MLIDLGATIFLRPGRDRRGTLRASKERRHASCTSRRELQLRLSQQSSSSPLHAGISLLSPQAAFEKGRRTDRSAPRRPSVVCSAVEIKPGEG